MPGKFVRSSILTFLVLASAGFSVYYNSLDVPLYLDDYRNIFENRYVRIHDLSFQSLSDAAFKSPLKTRPVANISFAVDFYLHQETVKGYHLVNTVLHILTAFVLYLLFAATLRTPAMSRPQGNAWLAPFLASLLWLVHPLHTGSVTYIVQRMVLLAAMFYLLSLFCYVKARMTDEWGRRWIWFTCSLVSGLCAAGSKEIAVTLPLFIFLYEWYFFRDLERKWMVRWVWTGVLPVVLIAVLYFVFFNGVEHLLAGYENRSFSAVERVFTEFRIVLYYVSLLVFPHPGRLNLDHYVPVSHSLFDPFTTFLSALTLAGLFLCTVLAARKQRIISFALLWYLGNLVLESSFLGLELIFEHRVYLPSVFLFFALADTVLRKVNPQGLAAGLLAVVAVLGSLWTVERNELWRDPVRFWADSAAKSPQKSRPFMNLSVALRERGEIDGAIRASQEAIALDPRFVNAYVGLGAALAEKGDYAGAEVQYLKALRMMPDYAKVRNALGVLYARQGRSREAVTKFNESLRVDPNDVNALVNRASVMALTGNVRQAIADFHRAAELDRHNPDILFNLAVAYTRAGDAARAVQTYEAVLQLRPGDREALENLEQLRPDKVK